MGCLPCAVGACGECFHPDWDKEHCCCSNTPLILEPTKRGGPVKAAEDVTDVESTGRKRAAVEYPLKLEDGNARECEWMGLLKAGGGPEPIIGCIDGTATNRHHGPDKDTLNNSQGNVHRICPRCHNRWHTKNDSYYGERPVAGKAFIPILGVESYPHDPETLATVEQLSLNEVYWATNPAKRVEAE